MSEEGKLKALEGMGYVGALMIGIGSLYSKWEALRYFNVFGLVFAIIVIVRLMVMGLRMGRAEGLFRGGMAGDDEMDTQSISEMTEVNELVKVSE
jgi:hypothetical protein